MELPSKIIKLTVFLTVGVDNSTTLKFFKDEGRVKSATDKNYVCEKPMDRLVAKDQIGKPDLKSDYGEQGFTMEVFIDDESKADETKKALREAVDAHVNQLLDRVMAMRNRWYKRTEGLMEGAKLDPS